MKLYYWSEVADRMCRSLIDDEEVMKRLKREQFDAIFADQITFCGHGLGHALGINITFLISRYIAEEENREKDILGGRRPIAIELENHITSL